MQQSRRHEPETRHMGAVGSRPLAVPRQESLAHQTAVSCKHMAGILRATCDSHEQQGARQAEAGGHDGPLPAQLVRHEGTRA